LWGVQNIDKVEFFVGKDVGSRELALIYQASNMLIRHRLWNYKLAGALPKTGSVANQVRTTLVKLCMKPDWRGMMPRLQALFV